MRDFLSMTLIEPFQTNDWVDKVVGISMWACMFLLLFVAAFFICLIGNGLQPLQEKEGRFIERVYVAPHTTLQSVYTGKTFSLVPIHHPEKWQTYWDIDGERVSFDDKKTFDTFKSGRAFLKVRKGFGMTTIESVEGVSE